MPQPWERDTAIGSAAPAASGGDPVLSGPDRFKRSAEARAQAGEGRAQVDQSLQIEGNDRAKTDQQFKFAQGLAQDYTVNPVVKSYETGLGALSSALKRVPDATGDLALIYDFAKVMDPGSVVREGEMAMAGNTASMIESAVARYKKEFGIEGGGQLSPEIRNRIKQEMIRKVASFKDGYNFQRKQYEEKAKAYGLDPFLVVGNDLANDPAHREAMRAYDKERGIGVFAGQSEPGAPAPLIDPNGGVSTVEGAPPPDGGRQVVTGSTKRVPDPELSGALFEMLKAGAPFESLEAYGRQNGTGPWDREAFDEAVRYYYKERGKNPFAMEKDVDTSFRERIASSDIASYFGGAADGLTGGRTDELAGVMSLIGGGDYTQARDAFDAQKRAVAEINPVANALGNVTGGALATMAGGGAMARYAPNALAALAARPVVGNALGGAAYGAYYGSGDDNQNRLEGGASGALTGGLVGGAVGGVVKGKQALAARRPRGNQLDPAQAESVVQAGREFDVPVMTSDLREPTTFLGKLGRKAGEVIPLAGTGGMRANQAAKRVDAVRNLFEEFGGPGASDAVEAVSKDLLATRSSKLAELTATKEAIKGKATGAVNTPLALAKVDEQIAKLQAADDEVYAPVISSLERFKARLGEGRDIEGIEAQRKILGNMFEDANLSAIKGEGQKAINAIYDPLRKDIEAHVRAKLGDGAARRWAATNGRLSQMAGELEVSAFRRTLSNAETTPEEAAKLLFNKDASQVKRLYSSLSPEGRSKAQAAIIYEAAKKSIDGDVISAQSFAKALGAMDNATGVFFPAADKARLDGFVRLIKTTQHSTKASMMAESGAQATPAVLGYSIGQIFGAAALPVTAGIGILARVYESNAGRKLFTALGKAQPGSEREAGLINAARRMAAIELSKMTPANDIGTAISRSPGRAAADDEQD